MATKIELWNRQLDLQVKLTSRDDIEFLSRLPQFVRAKEVLEIGCGNGTFLAEVSRAFADKHFVGIDKDESLLSTALRKARGRANLRFLERDIFACRTTEDEFDFIVVRLVVQELKDLEKFLGITARALKPGGCLLVMESRDELTQFSPGVPLASELFDVIRKTLPKGGADAAMGYLKRRAPRYGLEAVADREWTYRTRSNRRKKTLVLSFFRNLAELSPRAFGTGVDRKRLRTELVQWRDARGSSFQLGFRFLLLEKSAPGIFASLSNWFGGGKRPASILERLH